MYYNKSMFVVHATLHFGQISLPNVTDCRYLGIIIPVKNCDLDLKLQMRKCYANANM